MSVSLRPLRPLCGQHMAFSGRPQCDRSLIRVWFSVSWNWGAGTGKPK